MQYMGRWERLLLEEGMWSLNTPTIDFEMWQRSRGPPRLECMKCLPLKIVNGFHYML